MKRRYFWKLFGGNAILLGLVLGVSLFLILKEFDAFHRRELTTHLKTLAASLEPTVTRKLDGNHANEIQQLVSEIGTTESQGIRITVINSTGVVLADSETDPATMESHANRPEVLQASREDFGTSIRWSSTISKEMLYVAIPVRSAGHLEGYIRFSMALQTMGARTQSARQLMWTVAIVTLLAAAFLALGLARIWSGRISRITKAAQSLSQGDLSARVDVTGTDEVAGLALSLNQMRDNLANQLATIEKQHRTLLSLIGQLHEGIVVADSKGRIVLINPAALAMLHLQPDPKLIEKTPVEQCIVNHDLQRLLYLSKKTLEETSPFESTPTEEIQLELDSQNGLITVLARSSNVALPATQSGTGLSTSTGRLLVMTDITELARTIQMKTNFVANASHQLRTPLSVIRSSIETLLNMDLASNKDASEKFLKVLDRHSSRLESMVEDLLDLSRIESPSKRFTPQSLDLKDVFAELKHRWDDVARNKGVRWRCDFHEPQPVVANPDLLTLVLDNLVDNAIKFTELGGSVTASYKPVADGIELVVQDTGVGIPPEDHERIFERFYQAKLPSSNFEARGTGLGLSIVKHAVSAIKGSINLVSSHGKGTTITITLSAKPRSVE